MIRQHKKTSLFCLLTSAILLGGAAPPTFIVDNFEDPNTPNTQVPQWTPTGCPTPYLGPKAISDAQSLDMRPWRDGCYHGDEQETLVSAIEPNARFRLSFTVDLSNLGLVSGDTFEIAALFEDRLEAPFIVAAIKLSKAGGAWSVILEAAEDAGNIVPSQPYPLADLLQNNTHLRFQMDWERGVQRTDHGSLGLVVAGSGSNGFILTPLDNDLLRPDHVRIGFSEMSRSPDSDEGGFLLDDFELRPLTRQ